MSNYINRVNIINKIILEQKLTDYLEKVNHKFYYFPYYLWIAGIIIILFTLFTSYILFIDILPEERSKSAILIHILFYFLSFYLFYIGNIHIIDINRKKGVVYSRSINIFGSRKVKIYNFDDIKYIEIVMKGNKKGANDNRKYFIRFCLNNNNDFEFGDTLNEYKIKEKYQISLAMIKGIILPEVKKNLIKDESIYEDYYY